MDIAILIKTEDLEKPEILFTKSDGYKEAREMLRDKIEEYRDKFLVYDFTDEEEFEAFVDDPPDTVVVPDYDIIFCVVVV